MTKEFKDNTIEISTKVKKIIRKKLFLYRRLARAFPKIQNNIQEQLSIIEETKRNIEKEKETSINEMNDYMNNYAHLTFDEYRRMKNGEPLDKKKR